MNKKAICIYIVIWAVCLAGFWLGLGQDALGYSLTVFYGVLPLAMLICSAFTGGSAAFGKALVCALLFGVSFAAIEYFTFSLANMITISFGRINLPQWELIPIGALLSFLGFGAGRIFKIK